MPEITAEQWEARRQRQLANGVGLVLYNPATDRTVEMALSPVKFAELPAHTQWEAYLLPALRQLELAKRTQP
jgi:hypothetical protein